MSNARWYATVPTGVSPAKVRLQEKLWRNTVELQADVMFEAEAAIVARTSEDDTAPRAIGLQRLQPSSDEGITDPLLLPIRENRHGTKPAHLRSSPLIVIGEKAT